MSDACSSRSFVKSENAGRTGYSMSVIMTAYLSAETWQVAGGLTGQTWFAVLARRAKHMRLVAVFLDTRRNVWWCTLRNGLGRVSAFARAPRPDEHIRHDSV